MLAGTELVNTEFATKTACHVGKTLFIGSNSVLGFISYSVSTTEQCIVKCPLIHPVSACDTNLPKSH